MATTGSSPVTGMGDDKNLLPPVGKHPSSERAAAGHMGISCFAHHTPKTLSIFRGKDTLGQGVCYCFTAALQTGATNYQPTAAKTCHPILTGL